MAREKAIDPKAPSGPVVEGNRKNLKQPLKADKATTGGLRGSDELADLGHPEKPKRTKANRA